MQVSQSLWCIQGLLERQHLSRFLLECKEKATSDNNKAQGQRKDTALSGQDDPSIAEKPVLSREHLPFSPRTQRFLLGVVLRRRGQHRQRPRVDLLVLTVLHQVNRRPSGGRKRHKTKLSFLAALTRISPFNSQSLYTDMLLVVSGLR